MTFQEFWTTLTEPVADPDKYDVFGAGVGGYQEYFTYLGEQFKSASAGTLSPTNALKLGNDFITMADRMDAIGRRLAAIPLPDIGEAERAIKGRLNQIALDMRYWGKQVVASASQGDIGAITQKAESAFKQLGAAFALFQVGESIYTAGGVTNPSETANVMAQKAIGFFAGMWAGAKGGAAAGALFSSVTANPIIIGAATVMGAIGGGYLGGKLGEGAWNAAYKEYLDRLPSFLDVGVAAKNQVTQWSNKVQGYLGLLDGTWLTSSSANFSANEKEFVTEVLATVLGVPVNDKLSADINKLFVADFTGEALVGRDILLQTILSFAKENGYATERITANAANVTLDVPNFPTSALNSLRDYVGKQLSPADQRGWALTGPSSIVVAITPGTNAAGTKNTLMVGTDGVDGLIGGAGDDDLIGGKGQDILMGGAGTDDIFGGEGDDVIDGGTGGDWLFGGAGTDTYQLKSGELFDVITDSDGNGIITVDGVALTGGKKAGEGYWISDDKQWGYSLTATGDLVISKGSSPDKITIRNWQSNGGNRLGIVLESTPAPITPPTGALFFNGDQRAKIIGTETQLGTPASEPIYGTYAWGETSWANDGTLTEGVSAINFSDVINASAAGANGAVIKGFGGNDALSGSAGKDDIFGDEGDDLIAGGTGKDRIDGGAGNDFIVAAGTLDPDMRRIAPTDTWTAPAGTTVLSSASTWGTYKKAGGEFVAVGVIANNTATDAKTIDAGSGNDIVFSSGGDDRLIGGLGNDVLDGGGGNDVIEGGEGDDSIQGDGILVAGKLNSTTLAQHGVDFIDGGLGNDMLDGGGQTDVMYGGSGNDHMFGDTLDKPGEVGYVPFSVHGADYMDGEDGDDYMEGNAGSDTMYGGAGKDSMWGDTGVAGISDPASTVGAWGDDYMDGEAEDDFLTGGGGNDTLYGGTGNDTLIGDDVALLPETFHGADYLDGEDGNDLIKGNGGNDTLLGGAGDDYMDGGNGDDQLEGGTGADTLLGGAGVDRLLGGSGNDILDGGTGADYMVGGEGSDTYVIDSVDDVIVETAETSASPAVAQRSVNFDATGSVVVAAFVDNVEATLSYILGENLENLTLVGTEAIDGVGNAQDNNIVGNSAANVLSGGGGDDFLIGGAGDDTYMFSRGDGHYTLDNTDFLRDTVNTSLVAANDTLKFNTGIADTDVVAMRFGADLMFRIKGTSDQVVVQGYYGANITNGTRISDHKIDRVEFGNGVVWDQAMIQTAVDLAEYNESPGASGLGIALRGEAGTAFNYKFPAGVITDTEEGNNLTFHLTQSNGEPLPAWLNFDSTTLTLSGTPGSADLGGLQLALQGVDSYGASDFEYLSLNVLRKNTAPAVVAPIADQTARVGEVFSIHIPTTTFADMDANESLTYLVTMNGVPIPSTSQIGSGVWATYDPATMTLTGTPSAMWSSNVRVVATDSMGAQAVESFTINMLPQRVWGTEGADTLNWLSTAVHLNGLAGDDNLTSGTGDDTLEGGDGHDMLDGGGGNNVLYGDAGNDQLFARQAQHGRSSLYGGTGNDTLTADFEAFGTVFSGDAGDDTLNGSGTDDVYYFNLGDGKDTVFEWEWERPEISSADRVVFGAGIAPADITVIRDGTDLVLVHSNGYDQITFKNWFSYDKAHQVESFEFSNGAVWSANDVTTASLTMHGTSGEDVIVGMDGNEVIYGYAGNDMLNGGWGNDKLFGGDGNDTLMGGSGMDELYGGAGNDTLSNESSPNFQGASKFTGGTGDDTLNAAAGTFFFGLGDGRDTITLSHLNVDYDSFDTIIFGTGIAPEAIVTSRQGNDLLLTHTNGLDQIKVIDWFERSGLHRVEFVDFANGVRWTASDITTPLLTLWGTNGADNIVGTNADDTLLGLEGDDILTDSNGNNVLDGSGGNDQIRLISAGYNTYEFTNQILGGAGDDLVTLWTTSSGETSTNYIEGGTGNDTIQGSWSGAEIYRFNLGDGKDSVANIPLANSIKTLPSGDRLVFGSGIAPADITVSRSGNDLVLRHSNGTDEITVKAWFTNVGYQLEVVEFEDGTVWSAGELSVWAHVVNGTAGADNLVGTAGVDTLNGFGGNDTLDGGARADQMFGGLGDDTYIVNESGDQPFELANEGTDTVRSQITWTLGANLENLTLTGTSAINGIGNALNNVLTGNSGVNVLTGGAGNDTYVVGTGDSTVEVAGGGMDSVQSSVTWTLGTEVENLTLTGTSAVNGTGNALNNLIVGNSAANTLSGGAGADTMMGGAGNDTYVVDNTADIVTENAAEGTDLVQSSVTYTLASNLENLTLTGTSAINGTGNSSNNTLTGNTGNNILDGAAGADTMIGGTGNDTYYVDNVSDVTTEAASAGTDTVIASLNWTLATNLENLTLSGTASINATGNAVANVLTGNAGNNVLNGGAGADTMVGGAGDDTYVVDSTTDVVTEGTGAGTDLVQSSVTYTLATNVENIILTGTTAINATGNALDNILTGNSGNNVLTGGAGNDTYVVTAGDTTTEAANAGTDTVQSAVTWTLATNLENLTLTGTAAVNGTGNTVDNILLGNAGANVLTGNAGNDTLNGGAGADSLVGGIGNDTYWLGRGYGIDTITENDATLGNTDVARFDTGIATNQLWFAKVGNNLDVSIIGTSDKFTLANWYLGNQYHVEQFKTSDGKTLLDSQVQNLVSAMASFSPPTAGQTTLPANYASSLSPVIAANWQ